MTIVFTIAHMTIGGAQRVTYNLIKWLHENTDAEVYLLVYSDIMVGDVSYDLSKIRHEYLSKGTFTKIRQLRKRFTTIKPDVIVSMGTTNALFDVPACAGLGIKHIISERNDPAHFGGRVVIRIISQFLMHFADGYVFQTRDAQKFYGDKIAKCSVIIPNPLFIGNDQHSTQYTGKREKSIVTAGRLNRQKNHPLLIRAFKKIADDYPDYKLIIYGEGPERENDERLILELGLQGRVLLPGTVNHVPEKIYKSSLFVMSSDFEGMPNALMEAMALGLPCISTDCPCGGPRELSKNGSTCLLVPVGDETALVHAMRRILDDQKSALKIGKDAMNIREQLSPDRICKQWYEYLKSL